MNNMDNSMVNTWFQSDPIWSQKTPSVDSAIEAVATEMGGLLSCLGRMPDATRNMSFSVALNSELHHNFESPMHV